MALISGIAAEELCALVELSFVVWRPHSIHLNPKEFVAAKHLV